ncbi:MAG TPA: saccharopine dehydrogenase NADP-binding domain-containing protein [Rhizomicrobium sp.]|nr:saccharopine dehydrogenase NADP-binding domain-containing protein [Rhizomicrobium sp.]
MNNRFMIYGATGYTGKLVAKEAKRRGLNPLLSGRNAAKLKEVAEPLGFDYVAVDLADAAGLDRALSGIDAVVHIAGPFSATSKPMVDACIRNRKHYLDITGEIAVLEALAARANEAGNAGVMLLPGVGFDVVPSDCLAAHMKRRMPDAVSLTLAIGGLEKMSRGTAKSSVESIANPVRVRRDGNIVAVWPPMQRQFDFGKGPVASIGIGWGDVATAYHSTGIPKIEVYFEAIPQIQQMAKLGNFGRWLMSQPPMQFLLKQSINFLPEGPSDSERAAGKGILIGEAVNAAGEKVVSKLRTPEGYTLTALTSIEIVTRVLAGQAKPGFQTPSRVFGPDFILGFEGCSREDLAA